MRNRLLWTTIELESVKMEASEEMKKYKDHIRHLLELLKIAYQERDEARDRLHKLLDKLAPPNPNDLGSGPVLSPGNQPDNYSVLAKANSSVTESNNSHSPVDSLLDMVSSPDSSSFVFANQRPKSLVQEPAAGPITTPNNDPRSCIIDELAKGKVLPQKGKLLQAVTEAGPLLQTLLLAGPLPQWRNPPPLQPIRIPPEISMKGCHPAGTSHSRIPGPGGIVSQKTFGLAPYHDLPRASPQMCSASMFSFTDTRSRFNNSHPLSSCPSIQIPLKKRQRSQ